jgi:SpoIIAA-like
MSAHLEQPENSLLVLRISGELQKSEFDAVQTEYAQKIAGTGPVKLLVFLENFAGWERSEAWGDTDFFFKYRDDFEKIAVVGHPGWEAPMLAFTGASMRKGPVKCFPETGESEARAWLIE